MDEYFTSEWSSPTGGRPITKRRPRCRIGLWALVATTLSIVVLPGASSTATTRGVPLMHVAPMRGGGDGGHGTGVKGGTGTTAKQGQRETLYEAYNMLHTLAQVCL